jgi:hypothetical protein
MPHDRRPVAHRKARAPSGDVFCIAAQLLGPQVSILLPAIFSLNRSNASLESLIPPLRRVDDFSQMTCCCMVVNFNGSRFLLLELPEVMVDLSQPILKMLLPHFADVHVGIYARRK